MAKGQKRSNREPKKLKKAKAPISEASGFAGWSAIEKLQNKDGGKKR